MKQRGQLLLVMVGCVACGTPAPETNFPAYQREYQQAAAAMLRSEVFHRYRKAAPAHKTALVLSAAEVDSTQGLQAVRVLFGLEPITGLTVLPDSTMYFSFGCGGTDWQSTCLAVVYVPDQALLSARLPQTTTSKRVSLGNGWYKSESVTSVAD